MASLSVWGEAHAWVHDRYHSSEISLSRSISRFLVILVLKELARILTRQRSVSGDARNLSIRNVSRVGVALQRVDAKLYFTVWSCDHSPRPRFLLRICSGQSLHPSTKLWWSTVPLDQGTHWSGVMEISMFSRINLPCLFIHRLLLFSLSLLLLFFIVGHSKL